jgi:hypothetical protein
MITAFEMPVGLFRLGERSLSLSGTGLDPLLLTGRGITLGSISVGSRADFEAMNRAIAMHDLHPVIDRTFQLGPLNYAGRLRGISPCGTGAKSRWLAARKSVSVRRSAAAGGHGEARCIRVCRPRSGRTSRPSSWRQAARR